MERDLIPSKRLVLYDNFNSHAHVERDKKLIKEKQALGISTHTLTWSVTEVITCIVRVRSISTHTLTWSVTGQRSAQASIQN